MELHKLTVPQLMKLQLEVNTLVDRIKQIANDDLASEKHNPYFALRKGTARRVVTNQEHLTAELLVHYPLSQITVTKPIAMGAAEKLLKEVLEPSELAIVMGECTEKKFPAPTLVYIGGIDG